MSGSQHDDPAQSGRPTAQEIRSWPAAIDVPTAGRCFCLGRDASYHLAQSGRFPVPVLRLGRRLVVTRASVMRALEISETPPAPPPEPSIGASSLVKADG